MVKKTPTTANTNTTFIKAGKMLEEMFGEPFNTDDMERDTYRIRTEFNDVYFSVSKRGCSFDEVVICGEAYGYDKSYYASEWFSYNEEDTWEDNINIFKEAIAKVISDIIEDYVLYDILSYNER